MSTIMILAHDTDQGAVVELKKHLAAGRRIRPDINVWSKDVVESGLSWREVLSDVSKTCAGAVLLLSAALFADDDLVSYCDYIMDRRIPVVVILAGPCMLSDTRFAELKLYPRTKDGKLRALSGLKAAAANAVFLEAAQEILKRVPG